MNWNKIKPYLNTSNAKELIEQILGIKYSEYDLQCGLKLYLDTVYPNIPWTSDLGGVRLHRGSRYKVKAIRSDSWNWPDVFVAYPYGRYNGLFLELKSNPSQYRKKKGGWIKNEHVHDQAKTLKELQYCGYAAVFAGGWEETIEIIEKYMKGERLDEYYPQY